MKLTVNLGEKSYDIIIEHNILKSAGKYFNLDRKVMVVTDDGVPAEYAETVKDVCRDGYICTIPGGEASKKYRYAPGNIKGHAGKAISHAGTVLWQLAAEL